MKSRNENSTKSKEQFLFLTVLSHFIFVHTLPCLYFRSYKTIFKSHCSANDLNMIKCSMVNRIQNHEFTKIAIGQLQTKEGRVTFLSKSKCAERNCNSFLRITWRQQTADYLNNQFFFRWLCGTSYTMGVLALKRKCFMSYFSLCYPLKKKKKFKNYKRLQWMKSTKS